MWGGGGKRESFSRSVCYHVYMEKKEATIVSTITLYEGDVEGILALVRSSTSDSFKSVTIDIDSDGFLHCHVAGSDVRVF